MVGLNISRKVMLMPLAMAAIFFRTGISYSVYRRGWESVAIGLPRIESAVAMRFTDSERLSLVIRRRPEAGEGSRFMATRYGVGVGADSASLRRAAGRNAGIRDS